MTSQFKLLLRYLINLGPWSGASAFLHVEWLQRERIKLKGLSYPFFLRKNTSDLMVFREVFLFKSYDLYYDNPTVIIDGGGNIGLTSLFLSQKFKSAKIYTIEPDLKNFKLLIQNVTPYNNIVPINAALWNKETDVKIKNEHESEWAFEIVDSDSTNDQILKGLPLSYIINQYKLDRIDILKLDIEGAEKELFTDNYDSWIALTKCIVIELHDWLKKDCSKAVFRTLAQYNFDVSIFNGMLLCINRDLK